MDKAGVALSSALGEAQLRWTSFDRVWRCKRVTLLFYQGWQYIAIPTEAAPGRRRGVRHDSHQGDTAAASLTTNTANGSRRFRRVSS